MKNYASFGKQLSKEQAHQVNGGISAICSSSNGVSVCRVTCANGGYYVIRGCNSVSTFSNCGREVFIACGTVYRCG